MSIDSNYGKFERALSKIEGEKILRGAKHQNKVIRILEYSWKRLTFSSTNLQLIYKIIKYTKGIGIIL